MVASPRGTPRKKFGAASPPEKAQTNFSHMFSLDFCLSHARQRICCCAKKHRGTELFCMISTVGRGHSHASPVDSAENTTSQPCCFAVTFKVQISAPWILQQNSRAGNWYFRRNRPGSHESIRDPPWKSCKIIQFLGVFLRSSRCAGEHDRGKNLAKTWEKLGFAVNGYRFPLPWRKMLINLTIITPYT